MTQPGSASAHGLDDFLGHKSRAGSSTSFLDNWKKRGDEPGGKPEVNVVLHTRAPIISVWQFPWPRLVTREMKGKDVTVVWSGSFNSWEPEDVLKRQYMREDSGEREYPPTVCPIALMLERIATAIRDGELDWKEALFKFIGDDPKGAKVLHAGAMVNQVKKIWEGLDDGEKRAALKGGFPSPREAWMENTMAKCLYVFTVVDYDNVDEGIQVAKETTLVGDKVKTAIRDRIDSEGDEKGNPLKTPYVIRWIYDAKSKLLQDRYRAVIIGQLEITDEIRELIVDKDPPNLDRYVAAGDVEELRASMEDNYCGPEGLLDWDAIFGPAEEIAGITPTAFKDDPNESADDVAGSIVDASEAGGDAAANSPAGESTPDYIVAERKTIDGEEACFAADGVELFPCDACQTVCRETEETCHNCGASLEPPEDTKPVAEMDLEECKAALAEEGLSEEFAAELQARVKELTPAPTRRRTRGRPGATKAKTDAAKGAKTTAAKGGKPTATQRAADKTGGKGVGF